MHPRALIEAYRRGDNITALLKEASDTSTNSEEIIETAYDLQTGSYRRALDDPRMREHKTSYGRAIADEILALTAPTSVLEPGVGEGTTLSFVLEALGPDRPRAHGFDISWSRIACCRDWLRSRDQASTFLAVASLFHVPYGDNSFDVVYTSHTIEPNGGQEVPILQELYRVASRYLILLEPGYELAPPDAQRRMVQHGYCRGLVNHASALGMDVVKHELFRHAANPLNPTAITVIAKHAGAAPATPALRCPRFGDPLVDHGDSLFSVGSLRAYPKLLGIPCLRPRDGIIASAYETYLDGEPRRAADPA